MVTNALFLNAEITSYIQEGKSWNSSRCDLAFLFLYAVWLSVIIWIGRVWPFFRSSNVWIATQFSIPIQYFAGEYLSRAYFAFLGASGFCKWPSCSSTVTPYFHPGADRGCSQQGTVQGEGNKGLTCLMQPKQCILPQSSYLQLKMQACQRTKGKGWGLLTNGFWAKSVPNRAVLGHASQYRQDVVGMIVGMKPTIHLAQKDSNIIYKLPPEETYFSLSMSLFFPCPDFFKVMCEVLCLV